MIEAKPVVTVSAIDHVVLHVRDVERSRHFYVDILGFEIERDRGKQLFLRCGSNLLGLFEVENDVHGGSEVNHMALRMSYGDRATVKAALEAEGIKVHGRTGDPDCVYFDDPDGHGLQLYTLEDQTHH